MPKALNNDQKRQWAEQLYTGNSTITQKEVAERVGVSTKTMGTWVGKYKWEELRTSLIVTKSEELRRLYAQVKELNSAIMQKPEGARYANSKEADVMVKITNAIRALETETSIAQIVEVSKDIIDWLRPQDPEQAKMLTPILDAFIKSRL